VRIGGNDGEYKLLDRYDLEKKLIFFFLLGLNRSSLSSLAALESAEILAFLFICQPVSLSQLGPRGRLSHSLLHLSENLHSNKKDMRILSSSAPLQNPKARITKSDHLFVEGK